MKKIFLAFLVFAGACASQPPTPAREVSAPTEAGQAGLSLLVRFMTGTFETVPQQAGVGDSTAIKLRQARIWPERPGEYWIYAEYARAGAEARPFAQRIYRLTESGGVIHEDFYRLPADPAALVGEWSKDRPFAAFSPADLRLREGCRVDFLQQMDILFNGGRKGPTCRGAEPGVDHEHAEFYISSSSLRTWEPGLDAAGKQVAGLPGPSEFRKILQTPQ